MTTKTMATVHGKTLDVENDGHRSRENARRRKRWPPFTGKRLTFRLTLLSVYVMSGPFASPSRRMRRPEESERDLRRCQTDRARVLGKDWCTKPRGFPPQFTKTVYNHPLLERCFRLSMGVLLTIEGNFSRLRAKAAHISGHLPLD